MMTQQRLPVAIETDGEYDRPVDVGAIVDSAANVIMIRLLVRGVRRVRRVRTQDRDG